MTLLQAQASGGLGGMSSIIMIVLMIVIFYFFIIRPQSKRQKELETARKAMKKGDKIMTAGGIYGTIVDLNPDNNQVTIEVWENVKMKVDINQIYSLEPKENKKK